MIEALRARQLDHLAVVDPSDDELAEQLGEEFGVFVTDHDLSRGRP